MVDFPQSVYGSNPNAWLENEANGWGADNCYPYGVDPSLRGIVRTADGTALDVRKELVPLVGVLVKISEETFGYPLHTPTGGFTGGYENRTIGGSSTPSAHSRARAIDFRAQDNPQSDSFISTWPPALIAVWESCGFYWGGRYVGARFDTMHLSYIRTPADVGADAIRALNYFATHGGVPTPSPTPSPAPAPAPAPTPAPPAAPSIQITVAGVTVTAVQNALRQAGSSIDADGVAGPATRAALLAFQTAHGLDDDGVVGPLTWAALNAAAPAWPLTGGQVFGLWNQPGSRSDGTPWAKLTRSGDPRWDNATIRSYIVKIQAALARKAGAPGGGWADGLYQQPTTDFVRKYQSGRGLTVDGMVGPDTWKSLLS